MGDLRSVYRFLAPALATSGYRVACMDLRGHGDSDATFDEYDDVATGRDMLALAASLGAPAVLVGNSMSSGAAAWAAAQAPDLVVGLVLIAPFVRNTPVPFLMETAFRLGLLRPWGLAAWLWYYRKLYPGNPPSDLGEHLEGIRMSLRRTDRWHAFKATTRTSHQPVEARLSEVKKPTLVVMGANDPDFPNPEAEARFVAQQLFGEVVMVQHSGHYPQAEYPEVVVPAVVQFLRESCHAPC